MSITVDPETRFKVLTPPITEGDVSQLHAGDEVFVTGNIYTARDAAHKRLTETLERGDPLPVNLENQVLYYVGPSPAKPGQVIGSAGPTTSGRVDTYTPRLLEAGVKATIGKGHRNAAVRQALQEYKAVYLAAYAGTGVIIARHIKRVEIVAYEDLGPEAIRKLTVERFPCTVMNDIYGMDLFEQSLV